MGIENIYLVMIGGFCGFAGNCFYCMGGTSGFGLVWRRYAGTIILALACNLIAVYLGKWVWQYLIVWPCLLGGMSLGYGGDNLSTKVLKRSLFALGVVMAVLVGVWATGFTVSGWLVFGLSVLIGSGSVALGVMNPFNNAPVEQYLVCQTLTMFVPFLAWIK
jgi:hypothetical protein